MNMILRLNGIDNIFFKLLLSLLCLGLVTIAHLQSIFFIGLIRENLILLLGNNKGTDQPEILDSLVGAFVICSIEV